jgi:hypothetical protein
MHAPRSTSRLLPLLVASLIVVACSSSESGPGRRTGPPSPVTDAAADTGADAGEVVTATVTDAGPDGMDLALDARADAPGTDAAVKDGPAAPTDAAPDRPVQGDAEPAPMDADPTSPDGSRPADDAAMPDASPDQGTADGPPATGSPLVVTPSALDLVAAPATSGDPAELSIANHGGQPVGPLSFALMGAAAPELTFTHDCPAMLPPEDPCQVTVTFNAGAAGVREAALVVSTPTGAMASAALTAIAPGGPAALLVRPAPLAFGAVPAGVTRELDLQVRNVGGVTLTEVTSVVTGSAYLVTENGCTGVGPGGLCTITVSFRPGALGDQPGTLRLTGTPTGAATISLTGAGSNDAWLTVDPESEDFPATAPGSTSAMREFTVTNEGLTASVPIIAALAGPDAAQFTLGTDTCTSRVLAPAETCTVAIAFRPTAAGARSAFLAVTAGKTRAEALLAGTSAGGLGLQITPGGATFPATAVNATSGPITFTVTNTSAVAQTLTISFAESDGPGDFVKSDDGCSGTSLPTGESCTVRVTFKPRQVGAQTALLSVTGAGAVGAEANLQGTGI